jgi:NAD(P)-dependent dehydrogenase (short-subunit alcohol dehydrogenase family)
VSALDEARGERASRFGGRVAIVTGGASGIGLATARRLCAEGGHVIVADRKPAPDIESIACDVGVAADVLHAVDHAFARFGRLDVVVNNAAIMVFKGIDAHDIGDVRRVLDVDFVGPFLFAREVLRRCTAGACIVNVASVHALQTTPLVASYAAAKAALLSLTRSIAIEGKSKGIRANAVVPGAIETAMLRTNPNLASGAEVIDPSEIGRPEDVAAAIAFLASDEAVFITGAALSVDGGRLARL